MRTLRRLAVLCVLLVATPLVAADPADEPLPPGALVRLGSSRLRVQCAQGATLAFSPDAKRLATGGQDGVIRLWDCDSGKEVRQFPTPTQFPNCVAFLAGGKELLAANGDGALRVWDAANGKELRTFGKSGVPIRRLELSADEQTVAALEMVGKGVVLSDPTTGRELRRVPEAAQMIRAIALSRDGKRLAVIRSGGNIVSVLDVATGRPDLNLTLTQTRATEPALAFAPDGKTVAVAGIVPGVVLWDLESVKDCNTLENSATAIVRHLAFSGNGRWLVGVGSGIEAPVRVWGVASRKLLREFDLPRGSFALTGAITGDGKRLAIADIQRVHLWDLETGAKLHDDGSQPIAATMARFTPGGDRVTIATLDGRVQQWDVATGRRTLGRELRATLTRGSLLSHDGTTVVSYAVPTITVADLSDPKEAARLQIDMGKDPVFLTALSPDGRTLLAHLLTGNREEVLYDLETGKECARLAGLPNDASIRERVFSPDGRTIVGFGPVPTLLRFWDARTGQELTPQRPADGPPFPLKGFGLRLFYAPDGKSLLTLGPEVVLWETATGRARFRWEPGLKFNAAASAFSPDGGLLALGSLQGTIRLFSTVTGEEVGQFSGHRGSINALDFSPDGSRLLSASSDTTTVIWDVRDLNKKARPAPAELKAEQLPDLWKDLRDADAGKAYRAVVALSGSSQLVVPFVKEQLPRQDPEAARIAKLIRDLDSDDFDVRDKAQKDLEASIDVAHIALRQALEITTSAEVKRCINLLLEKRPGVTLDLNEVRTVRTVEVLERLADRDAEALLEALAKGDEKQRVTREARTALERLTKRRGAMP